MAGGVKCIFCGLCMGETELSGHLSGYHNIKSPILRPNQTSVGTQIDPEDRCHIWGQKKYLCDDEAEPDVFQVEPVSVPEDTGASGETSGEGAGEVISCSRFRCSACAFVNESYSTVENHIGTKHKLYKLSRRGKKFKLQPRQQEMCVRLEALRLPEKIIEGLSTNDNQSDVTGHIDCFKENVEPQENALVSSNSVRKRGRQKKNEKVQNIEESTRQTRSSLLVLESDPEVMPATRNGLQSGKNKSSKASRVKDRKIKMKQERKSKAISSLKRQSERQSITVASTDSSETPEKNLPSHPVTSDDDEDIVNVLDKLIQETEEEAVITVDDVESRSANDNTLEELDMDCIILEEVNSEQ